MPALLPVANVARVTIAGTANGIAVQNVFHVEKTSSLGTPFTLAQLTAIATTLGTSWDNFIAPLLNVTYLAGTASAIDLGQEVSPMGSRPMAGNGIATGTKVPQSMCCVISWKIDRHYKGGHPRTYVGPLGDTAIQNWTSLAAGFITSLLTGAGHILTDTNTSSPGGLTVRLVTVHRKRANADLVPPVTSPITSYAIDSRLDTQRRRLGPDR